MLKINDISYSVEGRLLLENATAIIPAGRKVGVVGRNGTGKTTLFRLIRGELGLEGGSITCLGRRPQLLEGNVEILASKGFHARFGIRNGGKGEKNCG